MLGPSILRISLPSWFYPDLYLTVCFLDKLLRLVELDDDGRYYYTIRL